MEIIRIAGYTEVEKLQIARRYLVKKQREANGLGDEHLEIADSGILGMIRHYTKEAGVRNLEREIASICRKVVVEVVKNDRKAHVRIGGRSLPKHLGPPRYRFGKAEEDSKVGMATGLAWTELGGELLAIEVTVMPGKGKLIITGRLGDVMQESAQAALSYVRSRAAELRLDTHFYQRVDIHIHVPEGATPKDGPSAGITMATALVSALTKIPVRHDVAMTGEVTLRGRVLPIGGLKEKVLAAHRGGIKTVLIPGDNEKDIEEVPASILRGITIETVTHMDQVLQKSLVLGDPDTFLTAADQEPERIESDRYRESQEPTADIVAH
jgi:ATP-dependent Lon protease